MKVASGLSRHWCSGSDRAIAINLVASTSIHNKVISSLHTTECRLNKWRRTGVRRIVILPKDRLAKSEKGYSSDTSRKW
jgi:hypothetical protein